MVCTEYKSDGRGNHGDVTIADEEFIPYNDVEETIWHTPEMCLGYTADDDLVKMKRIVHKLLDDGARPEEIFHAFLLMLMAYKV